MVRESENRLFHNLTIFVTKNVAPNPHQMKQILESAGATVLTKMPRFNKDTDTDLVIVSTLDDERSLSNAIKSGCRIVSNEFVLTGILRHQIDFTSFNLFHTESEITQSPTVQSSNSGTSTKRRRTRKKWLMFLLHMQTLMICLVFIALPYLYLCIIITCFHFAFTNCIKRM